MRAMEISLSALDVEWRRLEIAAENIAHADIPNNGKSAPYQARSLMTGPKAFASYLNAAGQGVPDLAKMAGVAAYGETVSTAPPRLVREPGNPNANADGFVSYPSIDHAAQMTLMIKTSRAYEANIVAMNTAREMYSKALDLGRRS